MNSGLTNDVGVIIPLRTGVRPSVRGPNVARASVGVAKVQGLGGTPIVTAKIA